MVSYDLFTWIGLRWDIVIFVVNWENLKCTIEFLAIDTAVRTGYTQGAVTNHRRADIELSTITCDTNIAPELYPALTDLCDNALSTFVEKLDLASL